MVQRHSSGSAQLSLRLSGDTIRLLNDRAQEVAESRNGLADRLLAEALHTERHPLIYFRQGAAGVREPALVGTRLYVRQIISALRANDSSVQDTAETLSLTPLQVQAAVTYYAEFQAEVDAAQQSALDFEQREQARWERAQKVLAP
jgi:uncharacterized protein (DUF433 family)